jgi:predicted nucleotidyltransferase
MESTDDIIETLRQMKPELATVFKVHEIGMFGSVIRGEQREDSDIDILVDLPEEADLLDLIGLSQFLEERLHHKIDIVPKRSLREEIRARVLKEVRYLWEIFRYISRIFSKLLKVSKRFIAGMDYDAFFADDKTVSAVKR